MALLKALFNVATKTITLFATVGFLWSFHTAIDHKISSLLNYFTFNVNQLTLLLMYVHIPIQMPFL